MTKARRGILYITAVMVVLAPPLIWGFVNLREVSYAAVDVPIAVSPKGDSAATDADSVKHAGPHAELLRAAERDPMVLIREGQARYEREIRDYEFILIKQERLGGELGEAQEIEVRYRRDPLAIYMLWRKNVGEAKRALFRDEPAFHDDEGRRLARVEPGGAVIRMFVKDVMVPMRGEHADLASRRALDECGFETSFELMQHYCTMARERGELKLTLAGTGEVDGRPTYVIERHLPYVGENGRYPDAKLVLHMDQEWLLPVAVESYSDHERKELLGRTSSRG